jgi:hypothetical protein
MHAQTKNYKSDPQEFFDGQFYEDSITSPFTLCFITQKFFHFRFNCKEKISVAINAETLIKQQHKCLV